MHNQFILEACDKARKQGGHMEPTRPRQPPETKPKPVRSNSKAHRKQLLESTTDRHGDKIKENKTHRAQT